MILEKITYADVMVVDELEDTKRGDGAYGSTGNKGVVSAVSNKSLEDRLDKMVS